MNAAKVDKWGPFALWHRLTRGHWFEPMSDLVYDYCRVCLRKSWAEIQGPRP